MERKTGSPDIAGTSAHQQPMVETASYDDLAPTIVDIRGSRPVQEAIQASEPLLVSAANYAWNLD